MKKLIFIATLLLSLSSQAHYMKGGIGVSLGGKTEFNGTDVDHKSSFIFPLIAAYGVEFNQYMAIEGEFAVRQNEYKDVDRSGQAATLGANFVGSYPFWKMTVSAGGGPTYGLYKMIGADKDFVLGAQAFAGIDYRMESGIRMGVEYRYFRSLQDIDADAGVTAKYTSTAFILNAKFPF